MCLKLEKEINEKDLVRSKFSGKIDRVIDIFSVRGEYIYKLEKQGCFAPDCFFREWEKI